MIGRKRKAEALPDPECGEVYRPAPSTSRMGQEGAIEKHFHVPTVIEEFRQDIEIDSGLDRLISDTVMNYENCINDSLLQRLLDPEDLLLELDV